MHQIRQQRQLQTQQISLVETSGTFIYIEITMPV